MDFQMPQDLIDGLGYPEVTDAMKRKFLGENFFRLHGRDVSQYMDKVKSDPWSVRQATESGGEMWSYARARFDREGESVSV
jgi:hypothetical protein